MSDSRLTEPLAGNQMQAPQPADQQPNAPLSPPSWLERLPSNDNPYAKMIRDDPASGSVSLVERARLNAQDAFYRGSGRGSYQLNTLDSIAAGNEPPPDYSGLTQAPNPEFAGMTAQEARTKAAQIRLDLARHEAMPGFEGPLEGVAALAGTLGGGMLSPESWITKFPGVRWAVGKVFGEAAENVAGRITQAALSQGMINFTTDPFVQAGSISANLQEGWNPTRSALAFPIGAATGGVLQGGGESVGAVLARQAERRARAAEAPFVDRAARQRLYPPQPTEGVAAAPPGRPEIEWLRVEDPSFQSFPSGERPAPIPTAATAEPRPVTMADDGNLLGSWASVPREDRDLVADRLERVLERKGRIEYSDLPVDIMNQVDTASLGFIKQAIADDPAHAIRVLRHIGEENNFGAGPAQIPTTEPTPPGNIHDFVVAGINHEGQVVIGKKGQTHADLPGVDEDYPEMGFADSTGKYYSREEAAQAIRDGPTAAAIAGKDLRGGLEGGVLNEAQQRTAAGEPGAAQSLGYIRTYQPPNEPLVRAAIRDSEGKITTGQTHLDALEAAGIDPESAAADRVTSGWVSQDGRFMTRQEAAAYVGRPSGQSLPTGYGGYAPAAPAATFEVARAPIDDPLAMQQRGELTAVRAGEIRDELSGAAPEAVRGAPDHVDPKIWSVIADNLAKAEASREGGVSVVTDQMRYLPADGVPKNISEREATAVIARAIDAEAARGGDLAAFRADADAAYRAAGHGTPPDISAAEAARAAAPAAPHAYATVEIRPRTDGGFDVETPLEGIQYAATIEEAQRIAARYTRLDGAQAARYEAATGRNYADDWRNNEVNAQAAAAAAPAPLEGGIAGDVARQLIAAGRPEAEARARGALQQVLYETHAARFEGRLGTAEEIYRREGAQIVGGEEGELGPGELGQRQRTVTVGGHELPLNPDGTVTLYHATKTPEAADQVVSQKTLRSGGEPSVFLSTAAEGTGYGDHVIAVKVDPALLRIDDEFPGGRADFAIDRRNVKVADAERMPAGPVGVEPAERNLTVLDILSPDTPARKANSTTVENIAAELQERGKKALQALGVRLGVIKAPSPRTDEILSRAIAAEVKDAAQRSGHALDWYTAKVAEAMRVAAVIHPELATDVNARTAYTAALAITSQGENVKSNVRLTDIAYNYFKENGRFPTNLSVADPAINVNLAKFNTFLDRLGPDRLREFLHTEYTVRELEAASGIKLGDELKDTRVYGSMIFGPKIGQGFFQNLNGNFTPVTMDLWFMRAWGRLTGTLTGMSEKAVATQRTRLEAAMTEAGMTVPKTMAALERRAEVIVSQHERDFGRYRAEYNDGTRTKSELTYAAERLLKGLNGINEQPSSGGMRNWIRARVDRARDLLAAEGTPVTNADLQALWWYPEKDLYGKMGGKDAEALNTDYAAAHRELAKQKGISDEDISRAVGAVEQRPRPADAGDVGGAIEGERGGRGAADGSQGEAAAAAEAGAAETAGELEQPGRAKIRLATDDANSLITLFRNAADASSGGHELAHDWLERLVRDAARPEAPAEFVADVRNVLLPWLGNDGGPLTVAQHEKFATGWEQYERTGRAPTRELEGVFAQFREWLLKIYETITGLGEPLTPEMRGFFDRLHAIPEKRAAAEGRLAEGLIGEPVPNMQPHRVATAGGDSVEVTPIVVEARDLIASNDAGYDPALQPRQRDRAASQQQVREIASRLDPERLGVSAEADRGAPIVGDDGMVESGNGRVMAIRAAYAENGPAAAAYRDFIARQGVDVTGFDQPVLVRQRTTPMSPTERQAFAVDANRAATLTLSAPERAMADARNLTPDLLDLIRNPDNLEAIGNRDFVRAFVESLPQAEQGAMANAEGGLSAEGATRIRHAILARAYGGTPDGAAILSRITESTQDEIRSISNALTAASPQWSRLRADIEAGRTVPEMDITPELLEAVRRTADLRNRGQTFADFMRQRDAFDVLSPRVEAFMSIFYDDKGTRAAGAPRIAERLKDYANDANKVSAEAGLDLGLPAVTADDIQRRIVERGRGGGDTGNLFGRERPDERAGGAGAGEGGAAAGAEVQRPGTGEPGAGAGGTSQPSPGSEAVSAGPERPAAAATVAGTTGTTTGVSGRVPVRGTPSPATGPTGAAADETIRTLHQQAFDLADALNFPLRQGRMAKPSFVGQYDAGQDVARARAVTDFVTVSHEAGHALEKHVGQELTDLTNRFAAELSPLDYDPAQGRVNEGFAEFLRHYLTSAPGYAESLAPGFAPEFRVFMTERQPAIMAELDRARAAYQAYQNAPTGQKLDAIVQRAPVDTIIGTIRREGMARSISMVLAKGYEGIFDDKAPVARAVRDLARLYRDASGNRLDLQGADNPELLVRMFARAHQAAVGDMMDGVRPYRAIEPQGPSLRDAMIKASGEPGIFGRWDDPKVKEFSNYLVARRSEVLWDKYDAGQLPRRPLAMSKDEIATAIAEAEAANPGFAEAAQMVHDYTRQLLRKQFDAGLIDRELFDKLSQEQFYVPLYRRMDDKPMAGGMPTGGAAAAEGPGTVQTIRRQTGSDRDIIDPIQGLMTQSFLVERTVAHNDIIKSIAALAEQARGSGATGVGRIVEKISATEMKAQRFDLAEGVANAARRAGIDADDVKVLLGALSDTFGDDPIMASVFRRQQTGPRGEPIVFYKEGGELRALRLIAEGEGTALYESLASLPPVMRDWAIAFGATSATAMRVGITANPVFALTNYVRDQLAAAILRPGTIPFNPMGIFRELRGDRYAQMYSYAGGVAPGAQAAGLAELRVEQSIEQLARKGWVTQRLGSIGDLVTRGNLLEGAKAIGETVGVTETGTRLNVMKSVFDQKKREGLSDYDAMLEAAYQATDLLDFGRHGSRTGTIRTLIPFLNAQLQALDKASRTFFQPLYRAATGDLVTQADVAAVKNAGLAWGLVGISAALGAAYATWGAQHEAYQDANEELRATHLIIPGGAFGYPGKILLAPKPFELAIGFNLGEMLGLGLATGDPRLYGFALGGVQEVLAPPNLLNSIPILKNYAELALNKSFFTRRDIVPQRLQALQPAEQFIPGQTSTLARQIGGALNISPIKIDYAIGNTFGLWGKDVLAMSNTADPNAAAPSLENQMFFRRFIKGADVASETTKRFWDLAGQQNGQYAQANNTYAAMVRDHRDKDAAEFVAALPAPERVYVTLQSSGDENGRAVFTADEKRLHPLTRAADAVLSNGAYIRELAGNTQQSIETQEQLALDPEHRRQVIDALRQLSAIEQRNALVIAGEKAYAGRKLLSAEDQFAVIRAISPEAADEIATRYAAAKIPPTETVARLWPEAQQRLMTEGSEATLRDLMYESKADGTAFEADRVKKAPKRRIAIAPGATPSPIVPLPLSSPLPPPPQVSPAMAPASP